MTTASRKVLRASVLVIVILLAAWLIRITDARYILRTTLEKIQGLGPLAPVYFILTYAVACLVFFPGFILTLAAGILFGVVEGTLYVSIGATIGAACAFLLSRYVAGDWVHAKFASSAKFQAIDEAVVRDGWKIVGLIRLSPVFPFIPLNFLFGLTSIPFHHFVLATWVAMIPLCAMFVYLGSLVGDIAALGTQPVVTGKAKWVVAGFGALTTIVVSLFVTRMARRALAEKSPGEIANEEPGDRAVSE